MLPEIICLAQDQAAGKAWADALDRDRSAGLIPHWIGAVVVSVLPDGSAQLTYVKRRDWLRMKAQHAVEMN